MEKGKGEREMVARWNFKIIFPAWTGKLVIYLAGISLLLFISSCLPGSGYWQMPLSVKLAQILSVLDFLLVASIRR